MFSEETETQIKYLNVKVAIRKEQVFWKEQRCI